MSDGSTAPELKGTNEEEEDDNIVVVVVGFRFDLRDGISTGRRTQQSGSG